MKNLLFSDQLFHSRCNISIIHMGCGASLSSTDSSMIGNMPTNSIRDGHFNDARRMIKTSDSMSSSFINGQNNDNNQALDKRNVLQLFNNLESTIQTMEDTKCLEKYRIICDNIEQLKEQLQYLNEKANDINSRLINATEINNEISIHDIIVDNLTKREFAPKDTFLIELLNSQKINELKIDILEKDIENFESELKELQTLCDQLHELYQQRDNLLSQLFEGNYGSEKEVQLEKELDSFMEERHYIEIAKIRWINSDNIILDALKYFDSGMEKLKQFFHIPESDYIYRYTCIKEGRNSLVLANYNLASLHSNLQNVELPHVKFEDLKKFEKEIIKIFNDLSDAGLESFLQSILALRAKTVTQHKWIKEVLNKTIKSDLRNIREKCRNKSHELRFERAILIKNKQEEWSNQENGIESLKNDSPFDLRADSGVDSELDESVIADEQFNRILASGKESVTSTDFSNATPLLPGEKLAPIPTNKEIFGKIIQIRNRHIREMQEFEQNQQLTKARMSQGLKEKLNVRRTRRNRLEMHKRQLEALQEYPAN